MYVAKVASRNDLEHMIMAMQNPISIWEWRYRMIGTSRRQIPFLTSKAKEGMSTRKNELVSPSIRRRGKSVLASLKLGLHSIRSEFRNIICHLGVRSWSSESNRNEAIDARNRGIGFANAKERLSLHKVRRGLSIYIQTKSSCFSHVQL